MKPKNTKYLMVCLLENMNLLFVLPGFWGTALSIDTHQVKGISNIIEQDHHFIKRIANSMKEFKALHLVWAILRESKRPHDQKE